MNIALTPLMLSPTTTVLASPKNTHTAFYSDSRQIKLYHHQPPDCRFTFTVHFENLNKEQLSFFLRSLFLDNGLCHKIGGAKPLGAGTVSIRPLKIILHPDKAQYYRGQNNIKTCVGNDDCSKEINRQANGINIPDDVRNMLIWRPNDSNPYRYPDYGWFKQNSQIPLKTVASVYPNSLPEAIVVVAQNDIIQRWQKNQESGEKVVKDAQQKAEDDAKKKAYESLSPIEKALQIWTQRDFDLQYLYEPKYFDNDIKELPYEECQKQMLKLLLEKQPERFKNWKKTYEKALKNGKKEKEGPWPKLSELAKKLGIILG